MGKDDIPRVARRTVLASSCALLAGCLGGGDSETDETPTDTPSSSGDGSSETPTATPEPTATATPEPTPTPTPEGPNPALGDVSQQGDLELSSPAFQDGEPIPEKFGYNQQNVNPPLTIENVPSETESLALAMDDPDAFDTEKMSYDHWVVWNIPPDIGEIPEDWSPETASQGTNGFLEVGYGGPSPPDGTHRYRFKCFAVDTTFDLSEQTNVESLGEEIRGHVLATTQLVGTFSP